MQRRLVTALVGIALASVVFVGAGVLVLAQLGARGDTEAEIRNQIAALTGLVDRRDSLDSLRSLEATRRAFDLDDLDFVFIRSDGEARRLGLDSRGRAPGPRHGIPVAGEVAFTLDEELFERFRSGEVVLVPSGSGEVIGIQQLEVSDVVLDDGEAIGIMAVQGVVTIGRQARVWFVLSAIVVLVGSFVAAWVLARRLSRPIKEIEHATAAIAAGDFTVQVTATGDDELADLGRSVNRMAQDLQRSKALDQQFLMSVSHDLRTPLTAIAGYAEALRDGAVDDPVHTGEVIGSHANRLERLVGDLLDLARLDANRFTFDMRALDLVVTVGRTVAGLVPSARQHDVSLVFEPVPPIDVVADPDRLAQVIGNVIENAVKFAADEIVVSVSAGDSTAVVEIVDDGPGIAAADLPHVFERLYVSRSQPERAENPTGMGLAIARELTAAMGGTVVASSGPGAGTTMRIELPLASVDATPAAH